MAEHTAQHAHTTSRIATAYGAPQQRRIEHDATGGMLAGEPMARSRPGTCAIVLHTGALVCTLQARAATATVPLRHLPPPCVAPLFPSPSPSLSQCPYPTLQHYLTMMGSTVVIPALLVPAMGGDKHGEWPCCHVPCWCAKRLQDVGEGGAWFTVVLPSRQAGKAGSTYLPTHREQRVGWAWQLRTSARCTSTYLHLTCASTVCYHVP